MYVSSQLIDFFEFILIGSIIALVFDFFRAYRRIKKVKVVTVIIQDIIYFFIITLIIVFSLVKILNSQIRLYIFIAIFLGCCLYFSILSKFAISFYTLLFNMLKEIIETIFLPIFINIQIFQKIGIFLKKIWKKCCKMFLYMVSFICKFVKISKNNSKHKINDNPKRGFRFMKNKKDVSNKKKNKKFSMTHFFMLGFALYFVYTFAQQQIQINKYDSQIEMYSKDIENKKELVEYYNSQKKNTNSDEYIENVARESLGYVKPYEKIFIDANK